LAGPAVPQAQQTVVREELGQLLPHTVVGVEVAVAVKTLAQVE